MSKRFILLITCLGLGVFIVPVMIWELAGDLTNQNVNQ